MIDDDTQAAIRRAELALLASPTRNDPARVEELLHPRFVEIGRSGRRWSHDTIIRSLADEPARAAPDASEWIFEDIADRVVLVTYRISGEEGDSRHSSIWDLSEGTPRMRFHQGTRIPPRACDG